MSHDHHFNRSMMMDTERYNIQKCAHLSQQEKDRRLFEAIKFYSPREVNNLLEAGANLEARGPLDSTPVLFATSLGNEAVAELLAKKGADLKAKNLAGNNGSLLAVHRRNSRLVKLFFEAGIDSNVPHRSGRSLFLQALRTGNPAVIYCFFSKISDDELQIEINKHPELKIKEHYDNFKNLLTEHRMAVFKKLGMLFLNRKSKNSFYTLPFDLKRLLTNQYLKTCNEPWQALHADLDTNALCEAFNKCTITPSFNNQKKHTSKLKKTRSKIKTKFDSSSSSSEKKTKHNKK